MPKHPCSQDAVDWPEVGDELLLTGQMHARHYGGLVDEEITAVMERLR